MEKKSTRFSKGRQNDDLEAGWDSKVLDLARVTRVVAGGKRFKFRATVIVGNKAGQVGVGIGKGDDVSQAVEKGTRDAKKHVIKVLFRNETIPHEVEAKFKSADVLIKPAAQGAGIIAGGALRTILNLAGVKNVTAKTLEIQKQLPTGMVLKPYYNQAAFNQNCSDSD